MSSCRFRSPADAQLDLDPAALQIHFQRDQRKPFLADAGKKAQNLLFVHQQTAAAHGFVIEPVAV